MLQDVLSDLENSSSKDIDELKEVIERADALKFSPNQLEDARTRLSDLEVRTSLNAFLPYLGCHSLFLGDPHSRILCLPLH